MYSDELNGIIMKSARLAADGDTDGLTRLAISLVPDCLDHHGGLKSPELSAVHLGIKMWTMERRRELQGIVDAAFNAEKERLWEKGRKLSVR